MNYQDYETREVHVFTFCNILSVGQAEVRVACVSLVMLQRPLVFLSQSQSYQGGETVIVTGVAQQGFGGRRPKPKKKYFL